MPHLSRVFCIVSRITSCFSFSAVPWMVSAISESFTGAFFRAEAFERATRIWLARASLSGWTYLMHSWDSLWTLRILLMASSFHDNRQDHRHSRSLHPFRL